MNRVPSSSRSWLPVLAAVLLAACAQPARQSASGSADPQAAAPAASTPAPAAAAPAPAAAPTPPPILPYDQAVLNAANNLLGKAQLPAAQGGARFPVVIDPLIDGMTGAQSAATQAMGARIVALIKEKYPQYEVLPFTAANVAKSPLVLVGTFTGVNKERKTEGLREAFRICLALADLKSGKLVGKGLAFAQPGNVDVTPTAFFQDSPAWTEDPSTLGYIRTCQGTKAGDPINPLYVDRILAASMVAQAIDAYGAGKYADALALYESALRVPFGNQFRVFSGLYLTNWRLGRKEAATDAFGQMVDFGLENKRVGVKFLFRPGTTAFIADRKLSEPYPIWLAQLASRAARRNTCLEVTGHTSPSGPEPMNERLSFLRAEYVKTRLDQFSPGLGKRTIAHGVGSREALIGNGKDDGSDALDRRVEFKVIGC
ncbi:MAG: OmpA family protein [Betaproteobacteria bacterium]|jgi:outer membrane protein OmpA-like peptidoglycan-associated protein|nr:OmpA family protein [Betaproteobacteria bacterium]HMW77359.1 OmpA family protein [Rhodocyclaceae bacterium]HNE43950.1 OmpA family protein [Rhodocyclaceae bacterium]HNM23627.1 OmpA family protein [Rhodocyclaceae bacterium]HNM82728.1 OmpA family protein [Rhodocyclaceae bacterium]